MYLPLVKGAWTYLCTFQDVAIKHVVGWHVATTVLEELVTTVLQRAFLAQPPIPELVVYFDRGRTWWGGQYCGNAYRALLHQYGAVRLQSRRGDCSNNALLGTTQAESRWSRLKTEVLALCERPVPADLADAQRSVANYFNHYSHERLHASVDYQTPHHTHQQFIKPNALNCPA